MLGSVNAYCGDRDSLVRFCDGGWSVTHPPLTMASFLHGSAKDGQDAVCMPNSLFAAVLLVLQSEQNGAFKPSSAAKQFANCKQPNAAGRMGGHVLLLCTIKVSKGAAISPQ